jgi:serine protease
MAKKIGVIAVVVALLGAAFVFFGMPLLDRGPARRSDGATELPLNPFKRAAALDWQTVNASIKMGDEESEKLPLTFKIGSLQGDDLALHIQVEDESAEIGAFYRKETPTIEDLVSLHPDEVKDVKFSRSKRTVNGREFDCRQVDFTVTHDAGVWTKQSILFNGDVKGAGIVAWSIDVMGMATFQMEVAGFGSKDKVEWGERAPSTGDGVQPERHVAHRHRLVTELAPRAFALAARSGNEILVELKPGMTSDELRAFGARHKIEIHWESHDPSAMGAGIAVARVDAAHETTVLAELAADPLVVEAEHNEIYTIPDLGAFNECASDGTRDTIPEEDAGNPRDGHPNDALFDKQWHLRMIHAPEAWKMSTGKGVIVGVIDTGVAYENKRGILLPDLAQTEFVPGYDFIHDDTVPADDHGHGSHCAGTIAQSTNNGRGCAGVAPGARIMPLKVLSSHGSGTASDIAAAIRFAADHGCKVMNLSLGGGGRSQAMARAVKYAFDKGCVVCCAAGNSGRKRVEYPAAYEGALAVSSVGPSGKLAFYSSYGDQIWVASPGGDKSNSPEDGVLQNTLKDGQKASHYAFWQGTSMATPHVAGVSALLVELGVTNPQKVMDILAATAKKNGQTGNARDPELGYGVIDAEAACKAAMAPDRTALILAAVFVAILVIVLRKNAEVAPLLAVLGGLAGASGLFFARSLVSGLPVVSAVAHGFPEWGAGSPLFASALIPGFLGLVSVRSRPARSFALGLMLGSAAHLAAMAFYDYAAIAWVPSVFGLDRVWLAVNAGALTIGSAMVVRLARSKHAA